VPDDYGVATFGWINIVRRSRLDKTTKLVALIYASYADPDGTNVRPGIARVAYDGSMSYNTVQKHTAILRNAGLLGVVRRGSGRRINGRTITPATRYQLILHPDVMERIDVPTPAAADLAIEKIRAAKKGEYTTDSADLHPTGQGAEDTDADDLHPTARGAETPGVVDNLGTTDPAPVDNTDLHPTARGAETGPPDRSAPHLTVPENRSAPRLTTDLHPTGRGATYQRPTTLEPTNHPTAELLTEPHGDTRETPPNRDPDPPMVHTPEPAEPTAKIIPFRRPDRRAS